MSYLSKGRKEGRNGMLIGNNEVGMSVSNHRCCNLAFRKSSEMHTP